MLVNNRQSFLHSFLVSNQYSVVYPKNYLNDEHATKKKNHITIYITSLHFKKKKYKLYKTNLYSANKNTNIKIIIYKHNINQDSEIIL